MMRTTTQTLKFLLFVFLSLQLKAQTYPVLPAPDHNTDHNAFITGSVTLSGTTQKLAGILVKLLRVVPGADNVAVSYALSDATGAFSISGQSGIDYILEYEFPAAGFTASTGNPSATFTASAGANLAPDGGLTLQRVSNTITNCNVSAPTMTDWTTTIAIPKAEPLAGAVLGSISVFGSTLSFHPQIKVEAQSDSRIRALMIGASVSLSGPGGAAVDMESVKTFARTPTAQNMVLASGETLTYYDISSGLSTNSTVTGAKTAYLGTGNVVFDAEALASKTITISGGNTTSTEQTFANAGVCLTYVYDVDPLPVTLISFSATAEGAAVQLNWATTSETNSERFEIQKSADAKNWNALSSVSAKGESKTRADYNFTDVNPFNGQNFYRLKMIDRDGTFAYSRINSIKLKAEINAVKMYPNPAADVLTISTEGTQIKKIEIYNQAGQLIKGSEKASVDVSSFANGIYSVRAIYANGSADQGRIVVAH
ncbi:Por secretion system C-terminal sorting domain-containing protein [Dyadobacter koreensis]|uniref:Por secretion system C-terminal sorting domain-containing protein n=1 Tax=Dyadobacter koreensis TaxID=408657 RepID=A0A1H6QRN1_9BACT|nr:T9SS type A sorting domain-containing protein [Dyadobacter koreensis]SEI41895.1 Por secretion system C-terminal sorting domain-containing protein [Dyadobacter koreensis]